MQYIGSCSCMNFIIIQNSSEPNVFFYDFTRLANVKIFHVGRNFDHVDLKNWTN